MPPPEAPILSVADLAGLTKEVLEGTFANIWVRGEVSNFTQAASGHMYFTLKDSSAQLKCAFFRGFNLRLKFDPHDGVAVLVRGQLSFYGPRGDCQFYVHEMQPQGIGAAELALRRLKEKLLAKGYFDPRRKRPLPRFPQRIALIASPTGAAIRDMLELLAQRWPLTEVIVRPCRVQGDGAAAEIAASVRLLSDLHARQVLPLQAIVLGRGGGSVEDLAAFNEEIVAEAIVASLVPVVSAVGHEIDVTIADLVADRRAETPSAAIVALTPDRREVLADLREQQRQIRQRLFDRLAQARQQLDQLASRPVLRRPLDRIRELEQRLDDRAERLRRAMQFHQDRQRSRLAALAEQLESLSPLKVLQRGYSLTLHGGRVLRSSDEVQPGDIIESRLGNGTITSRVEETR